jgi:hypothetical protein
LGITVFDSQKPQRLKKRVKKRKKKLKKRVEDKNKSLTDKVTDFSEKAGISQAVDDVKQANSRSFDFEMYKLIYDSVKLPIKHLIKRTRVTNLRLNCVVATDDAFKTAMTYGFQSAAVSGGLAWVDSILTLRVNRKHISVTADFEKSKTEINMKCKVKVRVITAVLCLLKIYTELRRK